MKTVVVQSLQELPKAASQLFNHYPDRRVFAFYGDMGAGKTTFIKVLCDQLGVEQDTASPTFGLVHEYLTASNEPVYHMDLYRINRTEEIMDIGVEEYLYSGHYLFIEWPEIMESILPEEAVKVFISGDPERVIRY